MALLGASFQIGRSALAAYQSALAITGQNIANVGNPNYARQVGKLAALEGGPTLGGVAPGGGVALSGLARQVDEALEARLRMALGSRAGAEASAQTLGGIEALYNELSEYDLSTQLAQFFNSFAELQHSPEDITARDLVVSSADAVIRTLQRQRRGLLQAAADLNETIRQTAARANSIADEIATLNTQVVAQEARGAGFGGPLRDRRDGLLRELAELLDVEVRPQASGAVNVYVGSEPLVEAGRSRGLSVETELADGVERAQLRFADTHGSVVVRDGQLAAQLAGRDEHLLGEVAALDRLARGLIYEVNRVHAGGCGLIGHSSLLSSYAVGDSDAPLGSTAAGLPFPVQNGSFIVHVRNRDSGLTTTRLVEVDLDGLGSETSLNALAAALGGVPGLTAAVTADRRLQIDAAAGTEVWFSEDSSGALAALGLGGFFEGRDAASIDIQSAVRADPRLITASLSGEPNDGDNAARLALVGGSDSALLGGQTIQGFHAALVSHVAIRNAEALANQEAADAVFSGLLAQREAISGVSLDEEAINLTRYERAFQGATRYLSVLDNLTSEVLALVSP